MTHSTLIRLVLIAGLSCAAVLTLVQEPLLAKGRGGKSGGGRSKINLTKKADPPSSTSRVVVTPGLVQPIASCGPNGVNCPVSDSSDIPGWAFPLFAILGGGGWVLQHGKSIKDVWNHAIAEQAAQNKDREKQVKKSPVQTVRKLTPLADPIEMELNQLKADAGLTQMRSVKKAASSNPKPLTEKFEWYVFRSGQPVGPYSKEQLKSVQQITDRTNVRREGETEWIRAGQIAELVPFLNAK